MRNALSLPNKKIWISSLPCCSRTRKEGDKEDITSWKEILLPFIYFILTHSTKSDQGHAIPQVCAKEASN